MFKSPINKIILAAVLMLGPVGLASAVPTPVDLELSLLVDVSASVNASEFDLQKTGYANAFNDPTVLAAIQNGNIGKIAVNLIYWSSSGDQNQAVGWTLIEDSTSAANFATAITNSTRPFSGLTAPGSAINFAAPLFGTNNFDGARNVIDISSDGAENSGADTSDARDAAHALGIDINALTIGDSQSLVDFYTNNAIIGDNAFVIPVDDFAGFGDAIKEKLALEINPCDPQTDPFQCEGDPCESNPNLPQCGGGGDPVVPEPSSMLLLGAGLAGAYLRKKK